MFILTEKTPNPDVLKFIPECEVMKSGGKSFDSSEDAVMSPLAEMLFGVDGVEKVFLGENFISVHKESGLDWAELKLKVMAVIMDAFSGHADRSDLLEYMKNMGKIKKIFLVHGEESQTHKFKEYLEELGHKDVVQPVMGDEVEL